MKIRSSRSTRVQAPGHVRGAACSATSSPGRESVSARGCFLVDVRRVWISLFTCRSCVRARATRRSRRRFERRYRNKRRITDRRISHSRCGLRTGLPGRSSPCKSLRVTWRRLLSRSRSRLDRTCSRVCSDHRCNRHRRKPQRGAPTNASLERIASLQLGARALDLAVARFLRSAIAFANDVDP